MNTVENLTQHLLFGHFVVDVVLVVVFALLYVFVCLFVWFVVVFLILKLVTRKLAETSQATKSEEKRMFSQACFLVTNSQANRKPGLHQHTRTPCKVKCQRLTPTEK